MLVSRIAVILVFCLADVTFAQHDVEFRFSQIALQIPEDLGRRVIRTNWNVVPHLYQADVLRVSMCINESTSVRISDIIYSNDGKADTIHIHVDGNLIGKFITHEESDWGNLWPNQSSSGFIAQTGMLTKGQHELTLTVAHSGDCFGVELWSLQAQVFTAVDPLKFWCGSSYTLADKEMDCGGSRVKNETIVTSTMTTPATTTPSPSYVKVTQSSKSTNCFDKRNVKVVFSTGKLVGTNITTKQDVVKTQAPQFSVEKIGIEGRLCDEEIWQLGKKDGSNNEFSSIYPENVFTINLTEEAHQERKFPMKLLPFRTSNVIINFDMPSHVDIKEGSAYFALGLVNLTKPVHIGLRYYDNTIRDFSHAQFVTFTKNYQMFGWNIPNLGKTNEIKNSFHLFFESDANVIMFDFLKLLYTKRDERKYKALIARRGHWKINGLRYETSVGMAVKADDQSTSSNIEDAIFMYQLGEFSRYKTVLRVSSEGMFYPYKTFYIQQKDSESALVDISGFYFNQKLNASFNPEPKRIQSLFIDTTNDIVKATFLDGSVLHLQMIITDDETKIQIIHYAQLGNNNDLSYAQNLIFTSTYVNDLHAAVNTIQNEDRTQQIMSDIGTLSGGYSFTIRKTSISNLFYANNVFHINFPK